MLNVVQSIGKAFVDESNELWFYPYEPTKCILHYFKEGIAVSGEVWKHTKVVDEAIEMARAKAEI